MKVDINQCARCGLDHSQIEFRELHKPIKEQDSEIIWTHYGICPTYGEPILLYVGWRGDPIDETKV